MVVTALLLLGLAIENAAAYPDYIPFFNVAAGGEQGRARLLSDSNIDWGQDLPAFAQWQWKNPGIPILMYYFGGGDPKYYGIHYYSLWVARRMRTCRRCRGAMRWRR